MYQKVGLILSLWVSLSVFAETVNLRGKVTNQNGKSGKRSNRPLVAQNLSDTTDDQGRFLINTVNVRENFGRPPDREKVTIEKEVCCSV